MKSIKNAIPLPFLNKSLGVTFSQGHKTKAGKPAWRRSRRSNQQQQQQQPPHEQHQRATAAATAAERSGGKQTGKIIFKKYDFAIYSNFFFHIFAVIGSFLHRGILPDLQRPPRRPQRVRAAHRWSNARRRLLHPPRLGERHRRPLLRPHRHQQLRQLLPLLPRQPNLPRRVP